MDLQTLATENLTVPAVMTAAQYFYDKSMNGFTDNQAWQDSMIMFFSQVSSKFINNAFIAKLVGKVSNFYTINFAARLSEPVINYFIYSYLFKEYFVKKIGAYPERSNLQQTLIPIVSVLIGQFFETYILSIITGRGSFVNEYDL